MPHAGAHAWMHSVRNVLWVGLVVGVGGWAVWRGQRRWMPGVGGAAALVAWAVLALTVMTTMGQLLGALGWLRGWGVLVATVAVAIAGWLIGRDGRESVRLEPDATPDARLELRTWPDRLEVGVLAAAIAALGAQWGAHLGDAYSRGMVQADNLWYHGPFVARIAQSGGLGSLAPFGYEESRFFPLNTHVLGAMLTLPVDSDVLIPVSNHVFAAIALISSWVIGCRRGAGVPAVLATMAVLSLPLVASTQPGQMYNDVAALALVLAGVAMFAVADGSDLPATRTALVITGFLALGWALSTKLTVVVPVAVLGVGIVIVLVRRADTRSALAGTAAFVLTGGVWFVRNLIVAGSPMPYADLTLGPIGFERQIPPMGVTLFSTFDELGEHGRYYLDSLDVSFGPLWFVVVAGALVAGAAGVITLRGSLRVAALAGFAGVVTFPLMPVTGELPFVNNLRYSLAAVVICVVVGTVVAATHARVRTAVVVATGAIVLGNLMSPHRPRVPAWPDELWWAIGGAVVGVGLGTAPLWWHRPPVTTMRRHPPIVGGAVVAAVVALAIALPPLEDEYVAGRYRGDDLPDAALYSAAIFDDPRQIDVFESIETYPYFGPNLDLRVVVWNDAVDEIPTGPSGCVAVRTLLSDGAVEETGRVVIGQSWLRRSITPLEREVWFLADPSVTVVYDDGQEAVYERSGPLDPKSCPES